MALHTSEEEIKGQFKKENLKQLSHLQQRWHQSKVRSQNKNYLETCQEMKISNFS
jgi:hypothetical protein